MIVNIFVGLALVAIGFVLVWKTGKFIEFFGTSDWADAKLGGGGTTLMYKFIGLVLIFVGFMWATNLWGAFLDATLGGLFVRQSV